MDLTNKEVVATLFRKVADAIKRLEPDDWEAVLAGNFTVELLANGGFSHRPPAGKGTQSTKELAGIRQALNEAHSRQSALALLAERCPSKDSLLQLSRYLDLPAQKRESIEKLQERIVEGTIGFRLRSRAVQGELPGPVRAPPSAPIPPESET